MCFIYRNDVCNSLFIAGGLEILRIVSILLIISFHYAFKGEFDFSNHLTMNKMIVKTFYMFGELGVNCFVLKSG